MTRHMHQHFEEKLLFGVANLLAAGVSVIGGILTQDEARWVYATLSTGILVATSCSLMTRRDESMRIVAGRSLFAVICTVLGTRVVAHYCPIIAPVKSDILLLAAVSGGVCMLAFFVGYGFIRDIDQSKFALGAWLKNLILTLLSPKK